MERFVAEAEDRSETGPGPTSPVVGEESESAKSPHSRSLRWKVE